MTMVLRACLVLMLAGLAFSSHARDDIGKYSISDTLALEKAREVLGTEIQYFFGDQTFGSVTKQFGEFRSNKKTNAFGKSDEAACQWAFLSALKSLKDRAVREGGNAVVNIRSNYKNNTTSSIETYDCGAGNVVAGVALIGDVVSIE